MRTRLIALSFPAACVALLGSIPGCGGVFYTASVNSAASRLEQAREIGAEQLAPYEYYFAKAHLEQAEVEATAANYGDAIRYADTADEYAGKAIQLSESAHRGDGRE